MACLSRQHNDTNILALAGRRTDAQTAAAIVQGWLATPFEGGRHELRLDKIRQWENKICHGDVHPSTASE
jgi:ribose 5-phosphate isomerase B